MVAKRRKFRYTDTNETTAKEAEDMSDMTMGQRIAEQRKKLGLSQEALGEKVGVSRQAISKWESDGTVPEIDKLIHLSKLFCVSVGWLLGVEESAPPQSDELTEAQLKMVEEIVRRYQPQPEEKRYPWVAVIAVLAAALVSIVIVLNPSVPDYSGQISSLQANYQVIQSQLQSLTGKVEDIASAAEDAEKLLQSHEFKLERLDPQNNTATLSFSAYPKKWSDTAAGMLSVSREGQQVFYEVCEWNGSCCTVQAELPIMDGYEYSFVVDQGDGTQQIQVLEEFEYNDLAYNTSMHCVVESFVWNYDLQSWVFRIDKCWIMAEKPMLGNYGSTRWTKAGLTFYRNGEEVDRNIMPVDLGADQDTLARGYGDSNATKRTIKLEEGDELKLTFYAALDNGMSMESTISTWVFQNGQLVLTNE